RYLKMMMDESSGIRKQDGALVFTSVANTEKGNQIAFYFLRNNWKELLRYYGVAFSILSKMVAAVPVYMNTQDKFKEMEQFWKQNSEKLGTAARSFQQAMETIQGNINWKNTSYHELEVWLSRYNEGLSTT
ncbi:unnamed protein product, partial [Timema podura]|nr:unnamed protein product [Timema podura]